MNLLKPVAMNCNSSMMWYVRWELKAGLILILRSLGAWTITLVRFLKPSLPICHPLAASARVGGTIIWRSCSPAANYLALALMMSYEAVHRVDPGIEVAGPETYARSMPWIAHSMLYAKPLQGWGSQPRARAVNFNDSAGFRVVLSLAVDS